MSTLWVMTGIIVPLVVGLGATALGYTPPEFIFAKRCFWLSALCLATTSLAWMVEGTSPLWIRILGGLLVLAGDIVGVVYTLSYVRQKENGRRKNFQRQHPLLYDAYDKLIDSPLSYVTPRTSHKPLRLTFALVLVVVGAVSGITVWRTASDLLSPAFSIVPGTAWISTDFTSTFFWIRFNGTEKVTPIDVLAFYTVTNLKKTPSLVSHLSVEMMGSGDQWYELMMLPTTQLPLWHADIPTPANRPNPVGLFNLPAGFLADKLANKPVEAGAAVQGWVLCQLPPNYIGSPTGKAELRLVLRDTATNERIAVAQLGYDAKDIIFSRMDLLGSANTDLRNYRIIRYGQP